MPTQNNENYEEIERKKKLMLMLEVFHAQHSQKTIINGFWFVYFLRRKVSKKEREEKRCAD